MVIKRNEYKEDFNTFCDNQPTVSIVDIGLGVGKTSKDHSPDLFTLRVIRSEETKISIGALYK